MTEEKLKIKAPTTKPSLCLRPYWPESLIFALNSPPSGQGADPEGRLPHVSFVSFDVPQGAPNLRSAVKTMSSQVSG